MPRRRLKLRGANPLRWPRPYQFAATVIVAGAAAGVLAAWPSAAPVGRTFYVSPTGSDRAAGRSTHHPWRTLSRVLRARLRPGDRVLLRGSATFSGVQFEPRVSGEAGRPIEFASYGPGRAAISASEGAVFLGGGVSNLVFHDLRLTTDGGTAAIVSDSASGPPSTNIEVSDCQLVDSGGAAVISNQSTATGWSIVGNAIRHVGDSGIIVRGGRPLISGNTIFDVGWNPAITWPKHGIYVKAPNATISGNTIRGFPANGISLRYRNARVTHNTISDGPIGIAYFSDSPAPGTSLVADNVVQDVSEAAFYYDGNVYGGGDHPRESFVIRDNDLASGGAVIDVSGAAYASIRVQGNRISGPYRFALQAVEPVDGILVERQDRVVGAARVLWNGAAISLAEFRAASAQTP